MDARSDAGLGACAFITSAHELVRRNHPSSVVNCGQLEFKPGAYNIIPELATLSLEFRSPDSSEFRRLEESLIAKADQTADQFGLTVDVRPKAKWHPIQMSQSVQCSFESAASKLNLSHVRLHSGAGHDAERMAHATHAGMLFIPSPNGISHDPREFSEWADCVNGANCLLNAALEFVHTV
jgi:N-carbamoyl-L-amino-acid hydrolase